MSKADKHTVQNWTAGMRRYPRGFASHLAVHFPLPLSLHTLKNAFLTAKAVF